LEFHAEVHRQL